jgi:hypothetical protein
MADQQPQQPQISDQDRTQFWATFADPKFAKAPAGEQKKILSQLPAFQQLPENEREGYAAAFIRHKNVFLEKAPEWQRGRLAQVKQEAANQPANPPSLLGRATQPITEKVWGPGASLQGVMESKHAQEKAEHATSGFKPYDKFYYNVLAPSSEVAAGYLDNLLSPLGVAALGIAADEKAGLDLGKRILANSPRIQKAVKAASVAIKYGFSGKQWDDVYDQAKNFYDNPSWQAGSKLAAQFAIAVGSTPAKPKELLWKGIKKIGSGKAPTVAPEDIPKNPETAKDYGVDKTTHLEAKELPIDQLRTKMFEAEKRVGELNSLRNLNERAGAVIGGNDQKLAALKEKFQNLDLDAFADPEEKKSLADKIKNAETEQARIKTNVAETHRKIEELESQKVENQHRLYQDVFRDRVQPPPSPKNALPAGKPPQKALPSGKYQQPGQAPPKRIAAPPERKALPPVEDRTPSGALRMPEAQTTKPPEAPKPETPKEPTPTTGTVSPNTEEPPIPEGHVRLYRGQQVPGSGKGLPEWVKNDPKRKAAAEAEGRWFTNNKAEAQHYADEAGDKGEVTYVDVPKEIADRYQAANDPEASKQVHSTKRDKPNDEHFLPPEYKSKAKPVATAPPPKAPAPPVAQEPETPPAQPTAEKGKPVRPPVVKKAEGATQAPPAAPKPQEQPKPEVKPKVEAKPAETAKTATSKTPVAPPLSPKTPKPQPKGALKPNEPTTADLKKQIAEAKKENETADLERDTPEEAKDWLRLNEKKAKGSLTPEETERLTKINQKLRDSIKEELLSSHGESKSAEAEDTEELDEDLTVRLKKKPQESEADAIKRISEALLGENEQRGKAEPEEEVDEADHAEEYQNFKKAFTKLEPEPNVPVSARRLREAMGMSKTEFDKYMIELSDQRKVRLAYHDKSANLTKEEKEGMIHDGDNNYYVAVTLR